MEIIKQNNMNKYAILTPSLGKGGAEKIAVNLANYYVKLGYEIDLVALKAEGEYLKNVNNMVNIVDLKIDSKRLIYAANVITSIRRYLKNNKPSSILSVLRTTNKYLGYASIGISNIKVIFREANTYHSIKKMNLIKKIYQIFIHTISYKCADAIIANSNDSRNDISKYLMIKNSKITVIPNPVIDNSYVEMCKEFINEEFLNNDKLKTIISIGRLHEQKNHEMLIRSFVRVHEYDDSTRLIIIGNGKKRKELIELIEEHGLEDKIKILDFKNNIYPFLYKSKVFALASKWEGFGNVIVEALATGKPVVCTDCPGGPRFILDNGKYGKLVPKDNEDMFANAIIDSLNEDIDQELLVNRALEFNIDTISQKYLNIID